MSLDDLYIDFIAVMPEGSIKYFKNKLRVTTLYEITEVFIHINLYEFTSYLYKNSYIYKSKIDELILAIRDELITRNIKNNKDNKENKSGLSSKAQEFIPVSYNHFPPLGYKHYN
jgi:hypothetical protein